MTDIAISTFGSEGAVTPFVEIGRILAEGGHNVLLISNSRHGRIFKNAPFRFCEIDTESEYKNFVEDWRLLNNPRGVPEAYRKYYIPKVKQEYRAIVAHCRRGQSLVISSETPGIAARLVYETERIPLILTLIQPNHFTTMSIVDRLISDVLSQELQALRADLALPPLVDIRTWWNAPHPRLALWPTLFHDMGETLFPHLYAGFVSSDNATDLLEDEVARFCQNGEAPVLITGGTAFFEGRDFWSSAVEGVVRSKRRFIAVCEHPELLPATLPIDSLVIHRVASFRSVLRRCSVLLHHGGMGTLSLAILEGKPQLIMADGGDRPQNAAETAALGVGIYLPKVHWSPKEISISLKQLDTDRDLSLRCSQVAGRLKPDLTTEVITNFVNHYTYAVQRNQVHACAFTFNSAADGPGDSRNLLEANKTFEDLSSEQIAYMLHLARQVGN